MKADYQIKGLDALTINCTIMGTGHFIHNIAPAWYQLDQVELAASEACMLFRPSGIVPKELRDACDHCSISLAPHEDFSLVVREIEGATAKYVLLYCELDDDSRPFSHFDILQKAIIPEAEETGSIYLGTNLEYLLDRGYTLISAGDDKTATYFAVALDHVS